MAKQRLAILQDVEDLCGPEVLKVLDPRDGWPAMAELNTPSGPQSVALHVGSVGLSYRNRDDRERRFQNPGQGHPVQHPPGSFPLLLGLWTEGDRPVLVGMDAFPRLGKETRQSLFVGLPELQLAADRGWAEYPSSSDETVIAFHPALLPTYLEYRATFPISAKTVTDALAASGFNDLTMLSKEERARRATHAIVRSSTFGRSVVECYGGLCAMCGLDFGLIQGAHILPATAPGSPDEPWNGLALCSNHHAAFDRHLIWVDPATREVLLHPDLDAKRSFNAACQSFIERTFPVLKEPSVAAARPRSETFQGRYNYFRDQYTWAGWLTPA